MAALSPLRLTGANILRDGKIRPGALSIAQGMIGDDRLPEIDLSGYLILPGIVDLHGDAFERHIAPRAAAPLPIVSGLATTERDAAAHGVTTAWFAQGWSWEGGMRALEQHAIDYVVFNSHLPETLEVMAREPPVFAAWAARAGRSVEALTRQVEAA